MFVHMRINDKFYDLNLWQGTEHILFQNIYIVVVKQNAPT